MRGEEFHATRLAAHLDAENKRLHTELTRTRDELLETTGRLARLWSVAQACIPENELKTRLRPTDIARLNLLIAEVNHEI